MLLFLPGHRISLMLLKLLSFLIRLSVRVFSSLKEWIYATTKDTDTKKKSYTSCAIAYIKLNKSMNKSRNKIVLAKWQELTLKAGRCRATPTLVATAEFWPQPFSRALPIL